MIVCSPLHPVARLLGDRGYPIGDLYGAGAWIYDALTRSDTQELAEILRLARRANRPVVEIGAGSGRITLPLLRAGHDVTAIDTSREMLELLEATGSSREVPGELTPVLHRVGRPYRFESADLVVCGTTTITALSLEDRLELFSHCGESLVEGGSFVFSTVEIASTATARSSQVLIVEDDDETLLVMILEAIHVSSENRTVTVVVEPVSQPEKRRVYATQSWILSVAQLVEEARACGLNLAATTAIGQAQDGRQSVLIEVVKGRTVR